MKKTTIILICTIMLLAALPIDWSDAATNSDSAGVQISVGASRGVQVSIGEATVGAQFSTDEAPIAQARVETAITSDEQTPDYPDPEETEPTQESALLATQRVYTEGAELGRPSPNSPGDALSEAALVGRWSNSGVKYGFSDDGYFYRSTVLSHLNTRSIYHSSTSRTYYSGNYLVTETTPGRWEYSYYYTYTYLNTLFGQYRVRGGVIQFDNVVSISHSTFDREWHRWETRGPDDERFLRRFERANFEGDFVAEFEFISPSRLRLSDKSTDRDFFWDFEEVPRNVPIPTHVIPPVEWPAKDFSPEMPELKTKGRLRESFIDEEERKAKLIIDKTDSLADIRAYVNTLRGASWWVEEPGTGDSLNLEARKGMWRLTMKSGNGSNTNADTVVIESTNYPEGKWPQEWTNAGLTPPQNSIIVGVVDNKVSESDRSINEELYFDRVNDKGVENYAAKLSQDGFKIPSNAYDNWKYYKYIRVNSDLYRVEATRKGRYGEITAFQYDFRYYPDGVWPTIWRDGGLPAPEGYDTIVGEIDMKNWDDKTQWYGSFSPNIKFLGFEQSKIDIYFSKLQSVGFTRKQLQYSDRVIYYNFLRIDGSLYRVEVEQQNNDELAEINYLFNYIEDGEWPTIWRDGGLPVPEGIETIAGAIDMKNWDDKAQWYGSFSPNIKFLGLDQREIDSYFNKLQTVGFLRMEQRYSDRVTYVNHLRLGDGKLYRVEIEQQNNDEIAELNYNFRYFDDGEWPKIWSDGGLPSPDGSEAIVGEIDMKNWDDKAQWYGYFSPNIKFLGLDQREIDSYFNKLQTVGFLRMEQRYSDRVTYLNHLRLGDGKLYRVEIEQQNNDEIAELNYNFRYFDDGEWPTIWSDGGLPAPAGSQAIVGEIDMKNWDMKNNSSFSDSVKFNGLDQNKTESYFNALQSAGFARERTYGDDVILYNYLRFDGDLCRVRIEKRDNEEIAEIYYSFRHYEEGVWPSDWQSLGIPAPRYFAIVDAFDLESWNNKGGWYGSFRANIKFWGADLDEYVKLLKQNGFTEPESTYRKWELEKRIRIGGVWYIVTIYDYENDEIPEVRYEFREESD